MSNRKMKVVKVSDLRQNTRKRQGSAGSSVATEPPQYSPRKRLSMKIRYVASANSGPLVVLVNTLMKQLGGIASSTTVLQPAFDAVKIKRIRIWSPGSLGVAGECSVIWQPLSNFGLPLEVTDTNTNSAKYAHLDTRPPQGSLLSGWILLSTASSVPLFTINVTSGSIIDIDYTCQFRDDSSPLTLAITGGLPQTWCYAAISANVQPVGLITVF